jgi:hypothetical protein
MNDDQIRDLLRAMRDDPIPGNSLARVRQAVAARTPARDAGRAFGLIWKLAVPIALAGCIAALLLRPARHTAPAPVQPVAVVEEPAPVLPQPAPVPQEHAHAVVRAARHLQTKPASAPQEAGASLIRIETSDPGVVILLLADGAAGDSAARVYAPEARN